MPPRLAVFKTMGSQDTENIKTTGTEIFIMWGFFESWLYLVFLFFGSAGAGVIPCLMNLFFGDFTSAGTGGNTNIVKAITPVVLKMVWVNIAMIAFMSFSQIVKARSAPLFATDLRMKVYSSLMNQPIEYFDRSSTGIMISRLSEDVTLVRETYIDKLAMVVQSGVQAIAGIILSFVKSWLVSCICLIAIPIVLATFLIGEKFIEKLWVSFNESSTNAASKAEEVISQFRTVKGFDGEMKEYDAYAHSLDGIDAVYTSTSIVHGIKDGIITTTSNGMIAAILYFISYLVVQKPNSGVKSGDMMVLMMCLMFATMGLTQVFSSIDDFRKANISARKLLEIINLPPQSKEGQYLDRITGKIEFKNVGFKYSSRQEYAVKDLSFVINPGETVALVGESGCGKTTTLQLLQKFYNITEGEILVDGNNINDLSPVFLRSQIAIVPQSPVLFSMSILDNIKYGKPNATDAEVYSAAEIGNAHDFIMTFKDNYKQEVQQSSLSGGQKQRICISRAILTDSPILLLDEATAALDTESEQLVQKSLERVRTGKTAIVVAHRLSTVKNADRILVFSNGKVVESGIHEELIEKGGIYAELVKFQLQ